MTTIKTKKGGTVLTLKNDFLFKVVYGSDTEESKTVLKALLNLILHREDDPVVDIHYKNPFRYRRHADDKEMVLDIKVTTSRGELIDVEMQFIWQKDLKERFITYHGGLISEALSKGQTYDKMMTTITIGIVDAVFLEDEDFLNEFYFMNRKSHNVLNDRSYICCIELPKVNREKKPIDELTPLEICLEYLKHADENGSEYVDALIQRGGKELQMAQEMLQKATEDEILREEAIAREKFARDMLSMRHFKEELERKAQELDQAEQKITQTMQELDQSRQELDQSRQEITQTMRGLAQSRQEITQTKQELARKEQDIARKARELAQKEQDIARKEQELAESSKDKDK